VRTLCCWNLVRGASASTAVVAAARRLSRIFPLAEPSRPLVGPPSSPASAMVYRMLYRNLNGSSLDLSINLRRLRYVNRAISAHRSYAKCITNTGAFTTAAARHSN